MMFRHIRTKMLFLTLPIVIVAVLVSTMVSIRSGKQIISSQIQQRLEAQQQAQSAEIGSKLLRAKTVAEDLAAVVSQTAGETRLSVYEKVLQQMVQREPFLLGAGLWFEPFLYDRAQRYTGPYVYRDGKELRTTYAYSTDTYDYFSQDYYRLAREARKPVYTKPYYDATSGLYMLTCAVPMMSQSQPFLGCVTTDISLEETQKLVMQPPVFQSQKTTIVSSDGTCLAASDIRLVQDGTDFTSRMDAATGSAVRKVLSGDKGLLTYTEGREQICLYFTTIPETGWKLIYQIPLREIVAPVYTHVSVLILIGLLALITITAGIIAVFSGSISKPVRQMLTEFGKVAALHPDDCGHNVLMSRKDEFGLLGRALHEMKMHLLQMWEEAEGALTDSIEARDEISRQNIRLMESEQQLLENKEYVESIIEVMPDILLVISAEGIFEDCRGSTETTLLLPRELFLQKHVTDIMPPDIAEEGMEKIRHALADGTMQKMEYSMCHDGQTDYFELRIMKSSETRVVAIVRRITEERHYTQRIEFISYHDQVTGLYNRRHFDEAVSRMDQAECLPLCVIVADVNGLKLVNDSFGHQEGDELLRKFSGVLKAHCGDAAEIARIGGDEFAVLIANAVPGQAEKLTQCLSDACERENVNAVTLSVSLGWGIKSQPGETLREVIKNAEDMMYQKKLFEGPSRRGRMIDVIISTLHEKNPREELHSQRVARLCDDMAAALNLPDQERKMIRSAGLLHDIGKIGIPEELLNKPGKLTPEEYRNICRHPEVGYRILRSADEMTDISDIIFAHHERWDGKGYPRGLKGSEIPFAARMIAIADTFDAMVSVRSYRDPMTEEDAVSEILRHAGTQFDPDLAMDFVYKVMHADPDLLAERVR